jgi:hypothetical protein
MMYLPAQELVAIGVEFSIGEEIEDCLIAQLLLGRPADGRW